MMRQLVIVMWRARYWGFKQENELPLACVGCGLPKPRSIRHNASCLISNPLTEEKPR